MIQLMRQLFLGKCIKKLLTGTCAAWTRRITRKRKWKIICSTNIHIFTIGILVSARYATEFINIELMVQMQRLCLCNLLRYFFVKGRMFFHFRCRRVLREYKLASTSDSISWEFMIALLNAVVKNVIHFSNKLICIYISDFIGYYNYSLSSK